MSVLSDGAIAPLLTNTLEKNSQSKCKIPVFGVYAFISLSTKGNYSQKIDILFMVSSCCTMVLLIQSSYKQTGMCKAKR